MTNRTTVINIKDAPAGWRDNPQYVYIGRAVPRRGLKASKWANPFKIGEQTRDDVIVFYVVHLINTGLEYEIDELVGKTLVCWCKPKACHGGVLAKLANNEPPF